MALIQTALLLLCLTISQQLIAKQLTIASYNIRNFDYDTRYDIHTDKLALTQIIKKSGAHLLGVQEIVESGEFKKLIKSSFPQYKIALSSCGGGGKQKLGFIYDSRVLKLNKFYENQKISTGTRCSKGLRPAAVGHFELKGTNIKFVAIDLHLKAGGRQQSADIRYKQYKLITQFLNELKDEGHQNFVIMGDLNTTDYIKHNNNYRRYIDFVDMNNLLDFGAAVKCTAYWWGGVNNGVEAHSILDHVLINDNFKKLTSSYSVEIQSHCKKASCNDVSSDSLGLSYRKVSDHCPLVATLKLK